MLRLHRRNRIGFGLVFCALLLGCSTAEEILKKDDSAQVLLERKVGQEMAQKLESKLKFISSFEVEEYLKSLAESLFSGIPSRKRFSVRIRLIQQKKSEKWAHLSLPGNRIYLSLPLLKTYEYEAEFAAALALEFARIEVELGKIHPSLRVSISQGVGQDGKTEKIPTREEVDEEDPEAKAEKLRKEPFDIMRHAVEILYNSGYDARAMVTFYKKLEQNSGKVSVGLDTLRELAEECRRKVSSISPLRNPIKQSMHFLTVRKRIHEL